MIKMKLLEIVARGLWEVKLQKRGDPTFSILEVIKKSKNLYISSTIKGKLTSLGIK